MQILHKLCSYSMPVQDLVEIYFLYIRSVCEQSSNVWHSSLTEENSIDLERVQKVALKIILKNEYEDYDVALKKLNVEKLSDKQEKLSLRFAKKCLKHDIAKNMFPNKEGEIQSNTRHREKYQVFSSNNERLRKSAIIYMQNQLNQNR